MFSRYHINLFNTINIDTQSLFIKKSFCFDFNLAEKVCFRILFEKKVVRVELFCFCFGFFGHFFLEYTCLARLLRKEITHVFCASNQ